MPGILCEHCTAACCRYIALPIDTPETRADYEDLRWFLLHERVSIFIEDGDWYIAFQTPCRHLLPDFRCGIYETRPKICRAYGTDNCDYHSGDYGWEHHFAGPEHLDDYLREHPPESRSRRKRGRRPARRAGRKPRVVGGAPCAEVAVEHDARGVRLPQLPLGRTP